MSASPTSTACCGTRGLLTATTSSEARRRRSEQLRYPEAAADADLVGQPGGLEIAGVGLDVDLDGHAPIHGNPRDAARELPREITPVRGHGGAGHVGAGD